MGFDPMDMRGIKPLDQVDTHFTNEVEAEHFRKVTWAKTELQRMLAKDAAFVESIGYNEKEDDIKGDDGRAYYLVLHLSEGLGKLLESSPALIDELYAHTYENKPFDFEKLKSDLRKLVVLH